MNEGAHPEPRERLLTQVGPLLVAFVLPLLFVPVVGLNLELAKAAVFLAIVMGTSVMWLASSPASFLTMRAPGRRTMARSKVLVQVSRSNPLTAPAVAFGLIYAVAAIGSADPRISWLGWGDGHGAAATIAAVIFFLLTTSAVRTWRQLDWLVTGLLLGSVPVAIYGLVQYLGLDPLEWRSGASPVGSTLGFSFIFGAYLVMVVPFTMARIRGASLGKHSPPRAYVIVFLLQFLCLLATLARGAILAWAISLIVFLWLTTNRWRRQQRIGVLFAVMVLGALLFVFVYYRGLLLFPGDAYANYVGEFEQVRTASNSTRQEIWRNALRLIPGSGLLGYGPETFRIVYQSAGFPVVSYGGATTLIPHDPHNVFLYNILSAGPLGLAAFLWVLAAFYRMTIWAWRNSGDGYQKAIFAAIIASATGYLVQAQFQPDAIVPMSLLWLVFALGAAGWRMTKTATVDGAAPTLA